MPVLLILTPALVSQTWYDNMGRAGDSKIQPFEGEEYTCVTFQPDLSKFKMQVLDKDTVALLTRRAYDIAGSSKGVRVFLNGKRLPVSAVYVLLTLLEALVQRERFVMTRGKKKQIEDWNLFVKKVGTIGWTCILKWSPTAISPCCPRPGDHFP